jgi:transcriptional regulator with XRE-family HTH domain
VRRERVRLDMKSQPALAKAAKVSPRQISDIERGIAVGPKTYDAIESVFLWPTGSIQAYLEGGSAPIGPEDPMPSQAPARVEFSAETRAKWRRMSVDEIIERGAEIGESIPGPAGVQARIKYLRAALQEKETQLSTEDVPQ